MSSVIFIPLWIYLNTAKSRIFFHQNAIDGMASFCDDHGSLAIPTVRNVDVIFVIAESTGIRRMKLGFSIPEGEPFLGKCAL